MTDAQDGTFAQRKSTAPAFTKTPEAHAAALRKQLDQAIKRYEGKGERDREAERLALAARLNGPRPAKKKQKIEPFVPRKD